MSLHLTFRNTSKEPLKLLHVYVVPDHYETPLWIAKEGSPFGEFSVKSAACGGECIYQLLDPAKSLEYGYRILGNPYPKFNLAFPQLGEYRVYLTYPLHTPGALETVKINSNVVRVRIKEPVGEDAMVWQQLNDPSILAILQAEDVDKRRTNVPMTMAKMLRSYPSSGYVAALRHALSKIYFHHRGHLSQDEQERLAQTLGIADVEALADERLGQRRKESLEKQTPLEKVLSSLNKLGVALDASSELKSKNVTVSSAADTIRLSMRRLSDDLEATWERRGNGYYLVPFDANSTKRGKSKSGD